MSWFQHRLAALSLPAFALTLAASSTFAQTAPVPADPPPAPVPTNSVPSVGVPAPSTEAVPADKPYQDPLLKPIYVAPGVSVPQQVPPATVRSIEPYNFEAEKTGPDHLGSTYIPVDSPVYPMALRLYSMGYLDTAFISMRPWTRRSLLHALDASSGEITSGGNDEAIAILARLQTELAAEISPKGMSRGTVYGLDTVYSRFMDISGPTLRDSYHLGTTINNDYGRPYATGFNNVTGFSSVNEWGRFSMYVRGEYQHAPARQSYSYLLANQLSCLDVIACNSTPGVVPKNFYVQDTIPFMNTGEQNPFRLQEASLSFHVLGHEISGGKTDAWLGPAAGGAMAWSNNAENIYSFRINRVEPLHIPLLSRVLGPLRYDFFVGSLKGHTQPNDPWIHSEMFSFRPTSNFEFSFQRSVIWGGKGHEPVTLHTFFRSFFDINDTTGAEKYSANDPGARFSDFSFSWRLPFLRKYVTLYTDSIAHDDVTPPSAPRRAAYRPGVFISQFPHLPKLDFRVEAASTDTSTLRSQGGEFNYFEIVQLQGYTNKGYIMGDWIGREAKGGQAWLTWHLSPDEWIQLEYLNKKTPKDFIAGGTTQNQVKLDVLKRFPHDLQVEAWYQFERWAAPVPITVVNQPTTIIGGPLYYVHPQNDATVSVQVTWHPKLRTQRGLNGK